MADEDREDDMDEAGEGLDGDGGAEKKGSKKKLFLIAGVVLLLVLGGAGAAYFTGLLEPLLGGGEAAHAPEAAKEPAKRAPPKPGEVVFFELPEMLVNLNAGGSRKSSFLKMRVSLELSRQDDVKAIETVMPRIIDNFQVYLRELRLEDLKGSAGMYRLREELLTRVNAAVSPTHVNDVLFKEMIVQ